MGLVTFFGHLVLLLLAGLFGTRLFLPFEANFSFALFGSKL